MSGFFFPMIIYISQNRETINRVDGKSWEEKKPNVNASDGEKWMLNKDVMEKIVIRVDGEVKETMWLELKERKVDGVNEFDGDHV